MSEEVQQDETGGQELPATQETPVSAPQSTDGFPEALVEVIEEEKPAVAVKTSEEELEMLPLEKNVVQDFPVSGPRTGGSPDTIAIPPAPATYMERVLTMLPNLQIDTNANQASWADLTQQSLFQIPHRHMYENRINAADSKFRQTVEFNGFKLNGTSAVFKSTIGTSVVDSERAILQLNEHMGIGSMFKAPMWNSGFWVTFKSASEAELLDLNDMIGMEVLELGRYTYGLSFSSMTGATLDTVMDFIEAHIYNTSVNQKEMPVNEIRKHLLAPDIDSFLWGFLRAQYPAGFYYETPCINNPTKCNHIHQATLNLSYLQYTDTSLLSDEQLNHMRESKANSQSLESIKKYQASLKNLFPRRHVMNEGTKHELAFTTRVPTVEEYVTHTHAWINGIVDSINRNFKEEKPAVRNSRINSRGRATMLAMYTHFIESIEFGKFSGDETQQSVAMVVDKAGIRNALGTLSAIDSVREEMITLILGDIDEITLSVIGVPAYDCPVCQAPQEGENKEPKYPRHTAVIPLDMLQVFFGLLSQRISRIGMR